MQNKYTLQETLINGMREFGEQTLVHGKEAGSENNCGYLRVLLTQPGAKVCRQIAAGPLISVSFIFLSSERIYPYPGRILFDCTGFENRWILFYHL